MTRQSVNRPVTSFLYVPQTISPHVAGLRLAVRIMLRFKILASAIPLAVAAILARIELFPSAGPCLALGASTVQIASLPWHADLHVSFTNDPALATVRVAVTDNAASADFAVIDDIDEGDDEACAATPSTQFVAISSRAGRSIAVIYLSRDDASADYRIFVRSRRFSLRDAAALIVGAHGKPLRLAAALR